jgi:hypothetical protein
MDVLRTAVLQLINAYISGTLFAVFRNPTFLVLLPFIHLIVNKETSQKTAPRRTPNGGVCPLIKLYLKM